ncbi:MAG: histidine phosphatase family protein [Ponticaulis sp.]|nr:histidine phosphatase family protein [Ponticaulis sp.]
MAVEVYVVRHGNTFDRGDVVTRVGARTDLPLSTSGNAQAEKLATNFAEHGLTFEAAYTGPLKRTRETLDRILKDCPSKQDTEILEFLREIDYGPDENMPEGDVVARIGQDAIDLWESDFIVPDGWQVDVESLEKDWAAFLAKVAETYSEGKIIVVTSNGIARFAAKVSEAHSDIKLKLGTAAFGIIEVEQGKPPAIKSWNMKLLEA